MYVPLVIGQVDANSIIDEPLMVQIKDNFEAHETRLDNTPPIGSLMMWAFSAAPTGWLFCDGQEISATTYELLFDAALPDVVAWGRGTKLGDFTGDAVTDEIVLVASGVAVDNVVYFSTTIADLPAGLAADTKYFVKALNGADRFTVSASIGGAVIDITDAGTGVHSAYDKFMVPDSRGRSPLGVNDAALPNGEDVGLTTRNEGDRAGEEDHVLTVAEMPSHNHSSLKGTGGSANNAPAYGDNTSDTTGRVGGTEGNDDPHNTMHPFFAVNFIIYVGS